MTFRRILRHAAIAATFCAVPALAAEASRTNPNFSALDRNRDGVLTPDEVRHLPDFTTAFREADENRDGRLDPAEFVKAQAIHDRTLAGKYVEDAVLTARVKAALLQEPDLKSLDVSVESRRGEVLLSGFVTDAAQRQKALKATVAVNGVLSVKDAMVVR